MLKKLSTQVEQLNPVLMEFLKFGIVGVSNTFIGYLINVLILFSLKRLQLGWDYIVANIVAFFLSVLWSYYWNSKYVFTIKNGKKRSTWKSLLKTYISYGFTGLILSNFLSYIWIKILFVSKYIAPLINLLISVPLNFVLNKLWAFKSV